MFHRLPSICDTGAVSPVRWRHRRDRGGWGWGHPRQKGQPHHTSRTREGLGHQSRTRSGCAHPTNTMIAAYLPPNPNRGLLPVNSKSISTNNDIPSDLRGRTRLGHRRGNGTVAGATQHAAGTVSLVHRRTREPIPMRPVDRTSLRLGPLHHPLRRRRRVPLRCPGSKAGRAPPRCLPADRRHGRPCVPKHRRAQIPVRWSEAYLGVRWTVQRDATAHETGSRQAS